MEVRIHYGAHRLLRQKVDTVGEKHVRIHNIHKTAKSTQITLFPVGFLSVHSMDTLLSHEAMGEELWMAVKQCNLCW